MSHCSYTLCLYVAVFVSLVATDYWQDRTQFLQDERDTFLGSRIELTQKEEAVNQVLMSAKRKEYLDSFASTQNTFLAGIHFFEAKSRIEQSDVFKFIQKMPKGGSLHGHDSALVSTEYLLKNLTYRDNLYACVDADGYFLLRFFRVADTACNWTLVNEMRQASGDADAFDDWLGQKLTLVVSNPRETYPDLNAVWTAFGNLFTTVVGLVTYRPVFEDHFLEFLKEFDEDNVQYVEFRAVMTGVYDLDGNLMTELEIATLYDDLMTRYVNDHPGFSGGKAIYAPPRHVDNATMETYLQLFDNMRTALPNFIAGFDLVGQEDKGQPLTSFIDLLLQFQEDGALFFFHAGETNWQGTTDENLIDAILLNTTRIGHGYALNKHPRALALVKERGIAIEVNPISNQVLMLVEDLRNHPAAQLMADNYPLVIGSDDPSFWGAKGLSYDMYAAFMGLGGLHADLRTLKQLALNSLEYSAMSIDEKLQANSIFESKWDVFLDSIIQQNTNHISPPSRKVNTRPFSKMKGNTIKIELSP